tara:strand:+ start:313 stop:1113 length:801 start_codon:yes stop_codon:yes gene_type:complete
MTLLQIIVLAVIQGISEFLPISSSGHLVLTPIIFGWQDQGLTLDVAVHLGTLGAVIWFLRAEIWKIILGVRGLLKGQLDDGARLAGYITISSIPVFFGGVAIAAIAGNILRQPQIIGWAFIIFGLALYAGDNLGRNTRSISELKIKDAILIGLFQTCALIPGASRAGTTITIARILGYERREAARFSMLLAIPAITGAGAVISLEVINSNDEILPLHLLFAALVAFITALLAMTLMMKWLLNQNFTPFVFYRVVVGVIILVIYGNF